MVYFDWLTYCLLTSYKAFALREIQSYLVHSFPQYSIHRFYWIGYYYIYVQYSIHSFFIFLLLLLLLPTFRKHESAVFGCCCRATFCTKVIFSGCRHRYVIYVGMLVVAEGSIVILSMSHHIVAIQYCVKLTDKVKCNCKRETREEWMMVTQRYGYTDIRRPKIKRKEREMNRKWYEYT